MSPKLLLVDVDAIQGEVESLAAFCQAQRDQLLKIAGLLSTDSLVPAADVARTLEAAAVWAATLADRLDDASEAIFSQVSLMASESA